MRLFVRDEEELRNIQSSSKDVPTKPVPTQDRFALFEVRVGVLYILYYRELSGYRYKLLDNFSKELASGVAPQLRSCVDLSKEVHPELRVTVEQGYERFMN